LTQQFISFRPKAFKPDISAVLRKDQGALVAQQRAIPEL
jgi:hypothetical protein